MVLEKKWLLSGAPNGQVKQKTLRDICELRVLRLFKEMYFSARKFDLLSLKLEVLENFMGIKSS